ncbi:apolipoprotein N-acyltransferase [Ideonella azotifigens]|uniref:Apolipoprotein N-acyltransferase n=2 Tax=Ideonella azotifigens TaxID=513160 RepID=A0ABP3VRU8_9BURK|nr:apolipoprotein N-acyltransferase [Ideonella azotifigens]MCD2344537.1 apolipoprotein N-acyltransferase [Ideonella azotifigens]
MSRGRLAAPAWRPGLLMLAAGALQVASFAPLGWWWLQPLCLALLAGTVQRATPRRAAWAGWCYGLGWLVAGLWWLYISMHDFGGMPMPLAALAVLLLAGLLSLYLALAMAAAAWLGRGHSPLLRGLVFAACWLMAELARAQLLTGFPWIASGYAHSEGLLAPLAPWVGVYGMGAVAALLAAALAGLVMAPRRAPALLVAALLLPVFGWLAPKDFTQPAGELTVSLLQPNVPQDIKFDPERFGENMASLQAQLLSATGQLVVTPESVLPVPRADLDPAYWASLVQPFSQGERAALIGTFLGDAQQGYVNSMAGVSARQLASGSFYGYGKRHLLPFGEFIPPGFGWFVELMQIPLGDQAHGTNEAVFEVGGQRVRPLICYEDLFGEDFAGSAVGPQSATMFVNASNLAWFGKHMMQEQHLQFSQLRAMEFQRPLVRATNTGMTAAIDHHGVVTQALPGWTTGVLDVTVQGRQGDTPYARWLSRCGLWPLWALVALVLLAARVMPRREGTSPTRASAADT